MAANRKIRKIESRVGSLNFPADPRIGDLTLRERLRIRLMRPTKHEVTFCVECRMPYVADTWRKYRVCSKRCHKKHAARVLYLDDWCWDHMPRRTWWDRTLYIREHISDTICKHCGWTFPNKNVKRKYCCKECKDAAYWKRRPIRICGGCGVRYRGTTVACSEFCYYRVRRHTRHFCARCDHAIKPGSEILPNADTRIPKGVAWRKRERAVVFCTGRCRDALGWSPIRKMCDECHQSYYPALPGHQRRQRYCSTECKKAACNRRTRDQRRAAKPARVCHECGDLLTAERVKSPAKYCAPCAEVVKRRQMAGYRAEQRGLALGIPLRVPIREGVLVAGD